MRKVLQHLPEEVNVIYHETLKRIDGQIEIDRTLAHRIFCWIVHAYRQLTLKELQHALAISPGMSEMNPDSLVTEQILTSICGGLVIVDRETSIVRLVRKFLIP